MGFNLQICAEGFDKLSLTITKPTQHEKERAHFWIAFGTYHYGYDGVFHRKDQQ
jgi:hypothetical protein